MMRKKIAPITELCSFCDGVLEERLVQKPCWWGKDLKVIVEGVPAKVCGQCGEIYYAIGTLKELDKLMKKPARGKSKKLIAVARYPARATQLAFH